MGDGAELALSQYSVLIDGPDTDDYFEDEWSRGEWHLPDPPPRLLHYIEMLAETEKAWLLGTAEGFNVWIPKSKCQVQQEQRRAVVPEWLILKQPLLAAYQAQRAAMKEKKQ